MITMEENNVPEMNPPPPPPQEAQLRAELEKVRGGNKILKIAAIVLSALFLLLAGAAFYIYNKVSQTKAAFEEAFRVAPMQPAGDAAGSLTMPLPGGALSGASQMPASSLGFFSGGLPGAAQAPLNAQQGEKIYAAMAKYENRPVVKEFIADLKKNPDVARAFAEKEKGGNPLVVVASIQRARGMDKIMAKYVTRPDFIKLMMEIMKDPAIRPLMKGAPGGLPVSQAEPATQSLPGSAADAGDAPMTLDSSAISATPAAGPAIEPSAPRKGKVPPPVDTQ